MRRIELVADPGAQRRQQGADFVVLQHLVEPRPLHVQDLAAQRQDGLEAAVTPLLGTATGAVTLDDVELGFGRITLGAVGQLARQAEAVQATLALHQLTRLARSFARSRRDEALLDDATGNLGILLQEGSQRVIDDSLHCARDIGVTQLALGLPLKLRLGQLHRDDRGQTLAHILSGKRFVRLQEAVALAVLVQGAGECGTKSAEVRATIDGVDVVGEGVGRFAVRVVVLQSHFDQAGGHLPLHVERLFVHH